MNRHAAISLFALLLAASASSKAQVPDLTAGGTPTNTRYTTLGPTGLQGWAYTKGNGYDGSDSRQILITHVDPGSPADGILQVGDVILGADGTGVVPADFSYEARHALADAIDDAEALDPAILKLLVWRAGATSVHDLTLETLGAYSATAPFDCPKSALIRERALQFTLANIPDAAYGQMGTLELLACFDPSNPAHAGIPARAAAQALTIVPTPERMELMMNGYVEYLESSASWRYGHQLVVLSEYHLATGDAQVLPAIQAIANMVANGGSIFGTYGHGFARDPVPAMGNQLAVAPYGPVNNAGLTCHLGLVLAKKCGVATPAVEATLERCNSYYGSHVGYGGIPYGENMPWVQNTGMNGKSGMAALAFSLQTGHHDKVKYFTKMAAASAGERQGGHSSPLFGQLWTPLGAALGGEQAFADHFARIRWLLTLNRRWDGAFVFNSVIQDGSGENNSLMGRAYYMNTVALLTYAVPLKKIAITGKYADPSDFLSASEVQQVAHADGYDATSRTISELLADCGSFSMAVKTKVAEEIGKRTGEHATALPVLSAMAADPSSPGRVGAMLALGRIANPSTLQILVDALMDPDPVVRKNAARAMQYYKNQDKLTVVNQIMDAVVANEKPLNPPDPDDPLQFAQSELSSLLFYGGNADGPQGFLINSLAGVDRERLYEVIRVISALPLGKARSNLRYVFDDLTEEDLKRVSGPVLDMTLSRAPGDGMFGKAGEDAAVNLLSRYGKAETIPAAKRVADSYKVTKPNWIGPQLAVLEANAGSCLLVNPDPRIVDFCNALQFLKIFPDSFPQGAQAVLDAIAADPSPEVLTPLKGIDSLTADSPVLTLPSDRTVLRADAFDYAGGSVFTWRKVHGAGEVIFAPNGTADAATTTVFFDGVPGEYLFEVTQSDWRNQTEVKQTVAVRLEMTGGGLPANDPPVADPQTLPVSRGLATPVILTGNDPEGHGLNYSILSDPANGILSGTPPLLTYRSIPGYTGTDTFDFQVMDSEGQVASATIALNVSDATPVGLAIYEPFNYGVDVALSGKSGSGDVGFASPWVATGTTTPTVRAGSLGDGGIPTLGGHVAQSKNNRADRAISTAALAGRGLLDDGKTLWFSVYAGYEANSNLTNSQLCIALANHTFASGTFNKWIKDDGTQLGSGIGIFVGGGPSSNIRTAEFRDQSFGTGTLGVIKGSWEAVSPSLALNEYAFIVGKITWGATPTDDDRIEVYHSITPYLLPEQPTSVLETQVDQGTFDMLTISAGDHGRFDEIRFGDSFQSVVAGTVEMSDDASAPTPDPPGLYRAPFVSAFDAISMSATPAFDPSNVEYYFTCTAGGGHDSGWQSSPHYTDTGLAPGVTYSYTVTTRDLSLARNTSSPSAASSATTPEDWVVRNMVGMNAAAAEYLIVDRGLSVGNITYAYHPTVPEGEIISQNLTAGSSALLGTAVDLVVSLGPAPGRITIASQFSFSNDYAPGDNFNNTLTATSPITIATGGFSATGAKLVAVLALHNSAGNVAIPSSVTFGGAGLNETVSHTGGNGQRNFIYYLDDVAANGDFVITFTAGTGSSTPSIDEVGLHLFALDGAVAGGAYASQSSTIGTSAGVLDNPFPSPVNAAAGDFVVGVATRNNNANTLSVASPYTQTHITAENLTSITGHDVVDTAGNTAPLFSKSVSGGSITIQSFAAFAAAAVPPSSAYDTWAATNAPATGSDPTADEDGDGVSNGIEFVLGGTIASNDLGKLPAALSDGTDLTFSFQRSQQSIDPSVAVSIEVGTDLATWLDVYPVPDASTGGPPVTVEKDTSPGMDTVALSVPIAPGVRKFARLKVEIIP